MIQVRKAYADGMESSVDLAKLFGISPSQVNVWSNIYDFVGYKERRAAMLIDATIKSVKADADDRLNVIIDLLKDQLMFATREGDLQISSMNDVKSLVETIHLIEGKPTSINKTLTETIGEKKLRDLVGDEPLQLAIQIFNKSTGVQDAEA